MKLRLSLYLALIVCMSFIHPVHAEEEYWEYTFRPGDTIWNIAKQYTSSVNNWSAIQQLNNIGMGPDRQIQPGMRIRIPLSMLKQQPVPALVIALNGHSLLQRANGAQEQPEIGSKLFSGDRIITSSGQSLRIQFADKSELQILPDSEIIMDKLSYHKDSGMVDTQMRLNRGRVDSWIEKLKPDSHFQIKTPGAITAVRGTRYRLASDASGQISRTEVTEGSVGVSVGDVTKQVLQGFGLVAETGKPLSDPVKLLSAPQIGDNLTNTAGSLKVSWTALDGAETYQYQLAMDADFNQLIASELTTDPLIQLGQLSAGVVFLRVRGIDKFQLQGLDSVRDFTIREKPTSDDTFHKVIIPSGLLMLN